eukprot:7244711-Prymnesium_polylepis.1
MRAKVNGLCAQRCTVHAGEGDLATPRRAPERYRSDRTRGGSRGCVCDAGRRGALSFPPPEDGLGLLHSVGCAYVPWTGRRVCRGQVGACAVDRARSLAQGAHAPVAPCRSTVAPFLATAVDRLFGVCSGMTMVALRPSLCAAHAMA